MWLFQRSGAPSGDSVIFVPAGSFKGSQLGDYYLLSNIPSWGFCQDSDMCDDSETLYGEPVSLWQLSNFGY